MLSTDLLLPLVSAASLPEHPSLSAAYSSPILTDMAQHACEMAQRERKTLASAKWLLTKLRGDETWVPCEVLCSSRDEAMFDTEKLYNDIISCRPCHKVNGFPTQSMLNGKAKAEKISESRSSTSGTELGSSSDLVQDTRKVSTTDSGLGGEKAAINGGPPVADVAKGIPTRGTVEEIQEGDVMLAEDMRSETMPREPDNADIAIEDGTVRNQDPQSPVVGEPQQDETMRQGVEASSVEGEMASTMKDANPVQEEDSIDGEPRSIPKAENTPGSHLESANASGAGNEEVEDEDEGHDASQAAPRRMRTRAQAQAASEPSLSSRNVSPETWVPPEIHPLFKIPALAVSDKDFALPKNEADETRRLLTMYVQKQEEVCRGAEKLYDGLLQADRQRKTVLKWCKAERHVGEMSDGEDWYDKEEWGLEEDLEKGHNDEDGDTNAIQGKKTRGRRA